MRVCVVFILLDFILYAVLMVLAICSSIRLPGTNLGGKIFLRGFGISTFALISVFVMLPLGAMQSHLFRLQRMDLIVDRFNGLASALVTTDRVDPSIINFKGEITPEGARLVEIELSTIADGKSSLIIDSEGGNTDAATRISTALQAHHSIIKVLHRSKVDCASACVNVVSSVPESFRKIEPTAEFLLHAPSQGFSDSYGPVIDPLIKTITSLVPNFSRYVIEQSPAGATLSKLDYSYQRKAADALEGPTVQGGRLQRSIDACPSHPFETVAGITLSWRKIQAIRIGTGPVKCPDEL